MSAAFSDASGGRALLTQCLWLTGASAAAFLVFRRRTRNALVRHRKPPFPAPRGAGGTEGPGVHRPPAESGPAPERVGPA